MEARASVKPIDKLKGILLGYVPAEGGTADRAVRTFDGLGGGASRTPNAAPNPSIPVSTRDIEIKRPTKYAEDDYREMQEITSLIRDRRRLIISFEMTPEENADKIFAWIMGSMAAVGGKITAIDKAEKVFLCQPDQIDSLDSVPLPR